MAKCAGPLQYAVGRPDKEGWNAGITNMTVREEDVHDRDPVRQGHVSAFLFTPSSAACESLACQLCLLSALTLGRFASSLCLCLLFSFFFCFFLSFFFFLLLIFSFFFLSSCLAACSCIYSTFKPGFSQITLKCENELRMKVFRESMSPLMVRETKRQYRVLRISTNTEFSGFRLDMTRV